MDIEKAKQLLMDSIIKDNIDKSAELFAQIINHDSVFCFDPEHQIKLARLLSKKNLGDLAVKAYNNLINAHPQSILLGNALFEAGKICYNSTGMEKEAVWFLKNFLKTNPIGSKFQEAVEMFKRLQKNENIIQDNKDKEFKSDKPLNKSPKNEINLKSKTDKNNFEEILDNPQFNLKNKFIELSDLENKMDMNSLNTIKPGDTSSIPLISESKFGKILKSDTADLADKFFISKKSGKEKNIKTPVEIFEEHEDQLVENEIISDRDQKSKKFIQNQSIPSPKIQEEDIRKFFQAPPIEIPPIHEISNPEAEKKKRQIAEESKGISESFDDKSVEKEKSKKAKWESANYTIIFEPGQMIDPSLMLNILSKILDEDPRLSRKRIVHGKGIISRNINFQSAVNMLKSFYEKGQKVLVVREDRALIYDSPIEISSCNFFENGFNAFTAYEEYKILSTEIFLMAMGGILVYSESDYPKNVLDIFIQEPHVRLRFWETTFNFKQSGLLYESDKSNNILNIIKKLTAVAPHAIICPNIKSLLKNPDRKIRHFHSIMEFENYADWMLLSYFGKDLGKKLKESK